jgi:CRISPR/Cas system-associated exonuclease Cas4 (RecB family)
LNANRNSHPTDHVSASQINLYLICPLKYRFSYVDKLPRPFKPADLALGTAFHAAVQWWHKHRKNGSSPDPPEVCRILEADLHAQSLDEIKFKNGESLVELVAMGQALIEAYVTGYQGDPIYQAEVPFRVPLVSLDTGEEIDLFLDGYFDLLEQNDTVVELKTAAKAYDQFTILNQLQLSAYAYAYQMLYGRPANLRLEVVTKTKRPQLQSVEVYRGRQDLVRFFHISKSVCGAIRSGYFHPNFGWQCANCEFAEPCRKWSG